MLAEVKDIVRHVNVLVDDLNIATRGLGLHVNRRRSICLRSVFRGEAYVLDLHPEQNCKPLTAFDALRGVVENIRTAKPHASVNTGKSKARESGCTVEELKADTFAGGHRCGVGDVAGAQTVRPKPNKDDAGTQQGKVAEGEKHLDKGPAGKLRWLHR